MAEETPAEIVLNVVPVGPAQALPTMEQAFMTLCRAMVEHLDDLPSQLKAEEIIGWYQNGNTAIAWATAVLLLEQAIGVRVRG